MIRMNKELRYALKLLEQRIKEGDFQAMYDYASSYLNIFPTEITPAIAKKIVRCLQKCLEDGDLKAALDLGAMYYSGQFVPRDYKKAIELYEMATKSESDEVKSTAWCNLGYCYYYGRDIPVNDEQAFKCYTRAALMNNPNALYKLGDMYRYGRYVAKDAEIALNYYNNAWDEVEDDSPEYADICRRIGECALYGVGMDKDPMWAFKMLREAETATYEKIYKMDPFAAALLPKIQQMAEEAKTLLNQELNL